MLTVLLSLRKQHSLGNFFRLLDGKDEAIAILLNYGKRYDTELVRDFWFQEDRRMEAACFALDTAAFVGLRQPSATEVAASEPVPLSGPLRRDVPTLNAEQFGKTMELVRTAAKLFSEDRDCAFESKVRTSGRTLLAIIAHRLAIADLRRSCQADGVSAKSAERGWSECTDAVCRPERQRNNPSMLCAQLG